MSTRTTIAAAVLIGTLAAPVGAQEHQHGETQGQQHGMTMSCPMMQQMMQGMPAGPATILDAAEALGLTAAQTDRLTELQQGVQSEQGEHMRAAMDAHRAAAAALEGDAPDVDAYALALNEAADHMVLAHVAMTRSALEARALLTPEQRGKLGELVDGMHGMHGGTSQGGGSGVGGHGAHH